MPNSRQLLLRIISGVKRVVSLLSRRRVLIVGSLFWLPIIIFVGLANEVGEGDTLAFDRAILQSINAAIYDPALDPYVVALTDVGGTVGAVAMTSGAALLLLARGYRRSAAYAIAVIGGANVMNGLLKALFARDRPSLFETAVFETSYAFPSGHAMLSSAMAFTAIVLAWQTRWRLPVVIAATVYFLTVSFTRLYLGVHYPTDIIGGWCIAAAWSTAMYYALRLHKHPTPGRRVGHEDAIRT